MSTQGTRSDFLSRAFAWLAWRPIVRLATQGDLAAAREVARHPAALERLLREPSLPAPVRDVLWRECPGQAQLLRHHPPAEPSLLVLASLELGWSVPAHLTRELLASRHPRSREQLLRPPHRDQVADELFAPGVPDEAVEWAAEHGLQPADPALRAAFLLLTGRLTEFEHTDLRQAYDRNEPLRHRLRAAIRRTGSSELAWAVLHQPASPRTDADWRSLLQTLLRTEDRQRLEQFVLDAPAWWSHIAVRAQARRGWLPGDAVFRHLAQLPKQKRKLTLWGTHTEFRRLPSQGPLAISASGRWRAFQGPGNGVEVHGPEGSFTLHGHRSVTVVEHGRTGELWESTRQGIEALAFDPTESFLASGGRDSRAIVWSLASREPLVQADCFTGQEWEESSFRIRHFRFRPGHLMIATSEGALQLDLATGRLSRMVATLQGKLVSSPDGARTAYPLNGRIQIEDGQSRSFLELPGPRPFSERLVFSPDGERLAINVFTLGDVNVQRLILGDRASDWKPVLIDESPGELAHQLEFSPDGRLLARRSGTSITVWDLERRRALHRFEGHALTFGPDFMALWTGETVEFVCPRTGRSRGGAPYPIVGQLLETRLLPNGGLMALQRVLQGSDFGCDLTFIDAFPSHAPLGTFQPRHLESLRSLPRSPLSSYIEAVLVHRFRRDVALGECERGGTDIEL